MAGLFIIKQKLIAKDVATLGLPGYRVVSAASGKHGLLSWSTQEIDLILWYFYAEMEGLTDPLCCVRLALPPKLLRSLQIS